MIQTTVSPESSSREFSMPRERGLLLKNLAEFQTELGRVAGGFIPGMADWKVRKEMPLQVFQDFRMVQDLRVRHKELGVAFAETHTSRAAPARELIELLCQAPSSADALEAIYGKAKARLADWLEELRRDVEGIYDFPSLPVLEANLDLLRKQIAWGAAARQATGEPDPAFLARVDEAIARLPEALTSQERRRAEPVREGRRIGRLPLLDGTVPRGFATRVTVPDPVTDESPYPQKERYYAANFLQEVQAADSCASLLFEAPDMPWDFYFDCARHMWDESRHAIFGEKKLQALGIPLAEVGLSTTAYRLRQTLRPHDRYAALTTQEADAFPGKHKGLKAALDNDDALGAMTWSYDIADETQHVRYGHKWLPVLILALQDPRNPDQVRADAENWRAMVLAGVYYPDKQPYAKLAPRAEAGASAQP